MRTSQYIQLPDAVRYLEAIRRWIQHGTPTNTFLTVNLEQLGTPANGCSKHLAASLQRLRKYLTRRGCPWCAVWVLENSPKSKTHVHVLIHRDDALLKNWPLFRRLVCRAFECPRRSTGMVKFMRIGGWAPFEKNLSDVARYTLKGIRPEVAAIVGVHAPRSQGLIYGKRIGWTRDGGAGG